MYVCFHFFAWKIKHYFLIYTCVSSIKGQCNEILDRVWKYLEVDVLERRRIIVETTIKGDISFFCLTLYEKKQRRCFLVLAVVVETLF